LTPAEAFRFGHLKSFVALRPRGENKIFPAPRFSRKTLKLDAVCGKLAV
jgi:hypothetical protein